MHLSTETDQFLPNRKESSKNCSALQHQGVGEDDTKLDNRAEIKGCSQTKKNACLHGGMACRR